jgi:hypothetical protein
MRIERDGLIATVEVYSPIEWEGLDYFKQDAWDTLRQLDVPYTYLFHFDVAQLQQMIGDVYRPLHPEQLTRGLDTVEKRRAVLKPLFDTAVDELECGPGHVLVEDRADELNISLRLELDNVAPLVQFEPRPGGHGGPGIGGYRPELVFEDVIGRALEKAGEGQAHAGDGLAVFIVDSSRLPLESEFGNESYRRLFDATLDKYVPSNGRLPVDNVRALPVERVANRGPDALRCPGRHARHARGLRGAARANHVAVCSPVMGTDSVLCPNRPESPGN